MNLTCILQKILDKKLHIHIYLQREMQSNLSVFVEFFENTSIVYYSKYVFGRTSDESRLLNRLAQFRFWKVLFNKVCFYFFSIFDAFLQ